MECRMDENKTDCNCPNNECERHGVCCECMRAHFANQSVPVCMRDFDWLEVKSTGGEG